MNTKWVLLHHHKTISVPFIENKSMRLNNRTVFKDHGNAFFDVNVIAFQNRHTITLDNVTILDNTDFFVIGCPCGRCYYLHNVGIVSCLG